MKMMSDRKMDMKKGEVDSEAFFPESAHHKMMPRVGEIKGHKYPDTAEDVHRDTEQAVSMANRDKPKDGFRH